jgi:hypothetical protein
VRRKIAFKIAFCSVMGIVQQQNSNAGIAQLVEHNLAKVGVASSSLVSRSKFLYGWVAEWLCSGLQSRGRRFDSDPSLHICCISFQSPGGGIGRRKGLKIPRGQPRASSSLAPGTIMFRQLNPSKQP